MPANSGTALNDGTNGANRISIPGRALWACWPAVSFLIALWVFVLRSLWLPAGWEGLILLVASPFLVPIATILLWLPRIIMRKRGHRSAPPLAIWVLWILLCFAFVLPLCWHAISDTSSGPSGLAHLAGRPVASEIESVVFLICCWGVVLSWTLLIVLSLTLKPRRTGLASDIVSVTVATLTIALASSAPALSATMSGYASDASGETLNAVRATSPHKQADNAEKRYQSAQNQLSEIRQHISAGAWTVDQVDWKDSYSSYPESYGYSIRYHAALPAPLDRDALGIWMSQCGYRRLSEYPEWIDAAGIRVYIGMRNRGDQAEVDLTLTTPTWWGDAAILQEKTGIGMTTARDTYAADDWPRRTGAQE